MVCLSPPWICLNNCIKLSIGIDGRGVTAHCEFPGYVAYDLHSRLNIFGYGSPESKQTEPPMFSGPKFHSLLCNRYCADDLRARFYCLLERTHVIAAFITPAHSFAGADSVGVSCSRCI